MKKTLRFRRKLINRYMRHLLAWNAYYTPTRKETPHELRLWRALQRARRRASRFPFPTP